MCMLPFSPRSSAYNSDNIYPIVKLKVNINVHQFHLITNIYIFVHQLTVFLQIRSCKFSNAGKVASKSIYYPACSLGNVVYENILLDVICLNYRMSKTRSFGVSAALGPVQILAHEEFAVEKRLSLFGLDKLKFKHAGSGGNHL